MAIDPIALIGAGSKVLGAASKPTTNTSSAASRTEVANYWTSPFVVGDGNSTPVSTPAGTVTQGLTAVAVPLALIGGAVILGAAWLKR
jgi:hypothetical protein